MKRSAYLSLLVTSGLLAAGVGLPVIWVSKQAVGYIPEQNPRHALWSAVGTASLSLPLLVLAAVAILAWGTVRPVPRWAEAVARWFVRAYGALLLLPSLVFATKVTWFLIVPVATGVLAWLTADGIRPKLDDA